MGMRFDVDLLPDDDSEVTRKGRDVYQVSFEERRIKSTDQL